MSFYCRYMTGRDHCSRRNADCTPGAEGCVLHGKVRLASEIEEELRGRDVEKKARTRRRSDDRSASQD